MNPEQTNPPSEFSELPTDVGHLDVKDLLFRYGEAMARCGQLENQFRILEEKTQSLEEAADGSRSELQSLLQQEEKGLKQKEQTIVSLKTQLLTAKAEIDRLKEKLSLAEEGELSRQRRRRRHQRHWWQVWR